ncbi:hypothetical protein DT076_06985 [Desertihabitans brevis]|uniref:YqeB PH domain-containing protein n=2 Tax=Desertihabitans brevis TaxID=2268447 RepID=A0A367YX37_9ACTN|nr:hypothetical protein DT076_06985 [Desertihabitans brevis]
MQSQAEVVQRVAEHVPVWVLPALGLVAGVVVGVLGTLDDPEVLVSAREIVVRKGDKRTRVARSQVAEAGVRDQHLVLFDAADSELLHQRVPGDPQAVERALQQHGWPAIRP